MPIFDNTTRPSDAVRTALAWAIGEVEAAIDADQIAETRYLPSKREFSAHRGSAKLTIYFSGSKWNRTGYGIWLHSGMAIRDSQLGRWRAANNTHAGGSDDFLDHVQLDTRDSVVWQPPGAAPNPFADHYLADLPAVILRDLSDALDTYLDPLSAVAAVPANHLTALNVAAFAEWAFARDRPDDAEEVLRVAVQRRPVLAQYVSPIAQKLGIARN
jgi:hypothetical protein